MYSCCSLCIWESVQLALTWPFDCEDPLARGDGQHAGNLLVVIPLCIVMLLLWSLMAQYSDSTSFSVHYFRFCDSRCRMRVPAAVLGTGLKIASGFVLMLVLLVMEQRQTFIHVMSMCLKVSDGFR